MPSSIHRLKPLFIKRTSTVGAHNDGGGLYLQVSKSEAKSWFYRYQVNGRQRKKGLGSYPTVDIEMARDAAKQCRLLRRDGKDPIEYYRQEAAELEIKSKLEKAHSKTFKECATEFIGIKKAEWTNEKHSYQWTQSLSHYIYPYFGDIPIQQVTVAMVVNALEKIWLSKTETATRVRQRVEAILDYAKALNYRVGENPARWKGHLDKILPNPRKFQKVQHHEAMPFEEAPHFYNVVTEYETDVGYLVIAIAMLTATRHSEVRLAMWDEVNFNDKTWTIPASRMKTRELFKVPLTDEAIRILGLCSELKVNEYIFPGRKRNKPISDTVVRQRLHENYPSLTLHGFRSTMRDWVAEKTMYPERVAEAALSHKIDNKTVAAYFRTDLFDKRRELMDLWSLYLLGKQIDSK